MPASRIPWTPIVLAVTLTTIVVVCATLGTDRVQFSLTEMLIRLVVVVGIYVFVGNSGVVSFGQIGFMCIGAYAAAWASVDPLWKQMMLAGLPALLKEAQYPFWAAIVGAGVLAGAVALPFGAAIMRLSGMAASIATFAFLIVVNSLYSNWDSVTGGGSSIIGVPTVVGPFTALGFALAAIFAGYFLQVSRYGLQLRASSDDLVAARASGVSVEKLRLIAFTASAVLIGIGGGLYAHFLGILNTETFYLSLTFTTLAMLVVGGIGSLTGAVSGVIVVTVVVELLRTLEAGLLIGPVRIHFPPYSEEIGLGILVALTLMFRPNGLAGFGEICGASPSIKVKGREEGAVGNL